MNKQERSQVESIIPALDGNYEIIKSIEQFIYTDFINIEQAKRIDTQLNSILKNLDIIQKSVDNLLKTE